jgi:predicted oxidoreductase
MTQASNYTPVIAGTMTWGRWGKGFSTAEMDRLMKQCLELGITTFEHADIYGGYTTEADFGAAFSGSGIARESIQLISKCGIQYLCEARPIAVKHYQYDAAYIVRSVEQSLQNLRTEYLDLLLLHRPSPLMHPAEVGEALGRLRDSGKVRSFGVSNFTPSQIALIESAVAVEAHQFECSLSARQALYDGVLDDCMIHRRTAMAWSPLGTYFREDDDHRGRISDALEGLCKKYGASESQMLLAWLLRHPAGIHPVVGTTEAGRLAEAVAATRLDLELEDWFVLLVAAQGHKVP